MAHAATILERSGDPAGAIHIQDRMRQELSAMPIEEALPLVVRACTGKEGGGAGQGGCVRGVRLCRGVVRCLSHS